MAAIQKECPRCGRSMVLLSGSKGKPARTWKCIYCDKIDPLTSPEVERWITGPLKPPTEIKGK